MPKTLAKGWFAPDKVIQPDMTPIVAAFAKQDPSAIKAQEDFFDSNEETAAIVKAYLKSKTLKKSTKDTTH